MMIKDSDEFDHSLDLVIQCGSDGKWGPMTPIRYSRINKELSFYLDDVLLQRDLIRYADDRKGIVVIYEVNEKGNKYVRDDGRVAMKILHGHLVVK